MYEPRKKLRPDQYSIMPIDILQELQRCEISHVVTVPDYVQISLHKLIEQQDTIQNVYCSTEDEAISIAAGLYVGGCKPVVIMQNQGLFASLNALRAAGIDASLPIFMMIGQFGREFSNLGDPTTNSRRRVVNRVEPLLSLLDIPVHRLDSPNDIGNIYKSCCAAFEDSWPSALVVGAHTAWPIEYEGKDA